MQERKRDQFYKKAKEEHYRSRASYKLLQAVNKYHFIKYGDIVIDLGAAPGGWMQVVKKIVGNKGFVLGVDPKPIEPFPQDYVRAVIGDMTEQETRQRIRTMRRVSCRVPALRVYRYKPLARPAASKSTL